LAASRSVIISGAGIGGLTAALTLARAGFRPIVLEQAARLEETGAGIQLPPNATRILTELGLAERLAPHVVAPEALRIMQAHSGDELAAVPLGAHAQARYGAPYWAIHRADLQAALLAAVREDPDVALRLGHRVEDATAHEHGVTVVVRRSAERLEERGIAMIAAEGLWSPTRARLGHAAQPAFQNRTAWRALVPADALPGRFRSPVVHLWLGRHAHLVHYPLKAGALINIVAIVRDEWNGTGWSEPGSRDALLEHFPKWVWCAAARTVVEAPQQWQKWALFDLPPLARWGRGPVTLLGDAAHPMLPFLAQGAAIAVEDAAVLADCLVGSADAPAAALRRYEGLRRDRTARVQRAGRNNSRRYHATGLEASVRNLALRTMGGAWLRGRYDWLYDWRAPELPPRAVDPIGKHR
jgi:salicylate hydroxylase